VTRRTENIAYQSSRLVRRIKLPQGTLKRMSISVLLDHNVRFEGSGDKVRRIVEPPSPERIKATRDLIAGAVGLEADRDQLIVESLPFESTLSWEPPTAGKTPAPGAHAPIPAWLTTLLEGKNLVFVAAGAGAAVLLLVTGIFLLRRKGKKSKKKVAVKGGPAELTAGDEEGLEPGSGESIDDRIKKQLAEQRSARRREEDEILRAMRLPGSSTKKGEVLAKHLVEENRKSPKILAQVVKSWMGEEAN
jgi:flagellar M-ring protein FliF